MSETPTTNAGRISAAARLAGLRAIAIRQAGDNQFRCRALVGATWVWLDEPEDLDWLHIDLTTGATNPEWRHERRGNR